MKSDVLKVAAKQYFEFGKLCEQKMLAAKDDNEARGLRMVSGQNYSYSFFTAIEYVLAKFGLVALNHEDRQRLISQKISLFKSSRVELLHRILMDSEISYRRKVAYKGENGNKFHTIKEAAQVGMLEIVVNG